MTSLGATCAMCSVSRLSRERGGEREGDALAARILLYWPEALTPGTCTWTLDVSS